jgi:hypothetical protein
MKKIFACLVGGCLGALVMAAPFGSGAGRVGSATSVPARLTDLAANSVSLYNAGSAVVYAQVNTTAAACSNAVVAGTAVPIPANTSFIFDSREKAQIDSVVYMTGAAASTCTVYIAWF